MILRSEVRRSNQIQSLDFPEAEAILAPAYVRTQYRILQRSH